MLNTVQSLQKRNVSKVNIIIISKVSIFLNQVLQNNEITRLGRFKYILLFCLAIRRRLFCTGNIE